MYLNVGKAHQRKVREEKAETDYRVYPQADIKRSVCKEISYEEAREIILEYEWLGTMGTTQIHYGIFFEGVLALSIFFKE